MNIIGKYVCVLLDLIIFLLFAITIILTMRNEIRKTVVFESTDDGRADDGRQFYGGRGHWGGGRTRWQAVAKEIATTLLLSDTRRVVTADPRWRVTDTRPVFGGRSEFRREAGGGATLADPPSAPQGLSPPTGTHVVVVGGGGGPVRQSDDDCGRPKGFFMQNPVSCVLFSYTFRPVRRPPFSHDPQRTCNPDLLGARELCFNNAHAKFIKTDKKNTLFKMAFSNILFRQSRVIRETNVTLRKFLAVQWIQIGRGGIEWRICLRGRSTRSWKNCFFYQTPYQSVE